MKRYGSVSFSVDLSVDRVRDRLPREACDEGQGTRGTTGFGRRFSAAGAFDLETHLDRQSRSCRAADQQVGKLHLEFDDLAYSYMNLLLGAQSKVREPVGESLPNQEIFRRLAGAMGLQEPALFEPLEGVLEVIAVSHPYMLVSREFREADSVVDVEPVLDFVIPL